MPAPVSKSPRNRLAAVTEPPVWLNVPVPLSPTIRPAEPASAIVPDCTCITAVWPLDTPMVIARLELSSEPVVSTPPASVSVPPVTLVRPE